ncbi:uncharacterized protein LOC142915509 [Petromyzon marinus]|uniref:uncharacterized protein LOC142915509 n=1 Tax=Petromyzon marinus TaxID=7757 RepID=UPI003F6E69C1
MPTQPGRQQNRQQPCAGSAVLTPHENEIIFNVLGRRCPFLLAVQYTFASPFPVYVCVRCVRVHLQSKATTVVQVFFWENGVWQKRHCGVTCFVKDQPRRSYFICVYEMRVSTCHFGGQGVSCKLDYSGLLNSVGDMMKLAYIPTFLLSRLCSTCDIHELSALCKRRVCFVSLQDTGHLCYEQELYKKFEYKQPRPFFHTFLGDVCAKLAHSMSAIFTHNSTAVTKAYNLEKKVYFLYQKCEVGLNFCDEEEAKPFRDAVEDTLRPEAPEEP